MPYVINWPPAKRVGARAAALALSGLFVAAATGVLAAPALADATSCSTPTLTQPFLSSGDSNWYALAPGESADGFDGTGWTLYGGASIVSTQLADGSTGNVLDMPGRSVAIGPPMCVESTFQTARSMIRGLSGHGHVLLSVLYQDPATGDWGPPQRGGLIRRSSRVWTLSNTLGLPSSSVPGWQMARFVFASAGSSGESQLYDFYVDPYFKG
jgi:hypothetical protein